MISESVEKGETVNNQLCDEKINQKDNKRLKIVLGIFALFSLFVFIHIQHVHPSETFEQNLIKRASRKQWKPKSGLSWNLLLLNPLTSGQTNGTQVLDIDLFDNEAKVIRSIKNNGAKVICYFSAGSYEDWRKDAYKFTSKDLGSPLDGWPGEWWINVKSSNVRKIMRSRLDLAVKKGCDAVDPDNVDGYNNKNGLGLTKKDAINYLTFLTKEAHKRKLAIGLKNAGEIVPRLVNLMDFSVNEQCEQYNECKTFYPFIKKNKPVFHVEYPKGDQTNNNQNIPDDQKQEICNNASAKGFSTITKNINLDSWTEIC